MAEGRGRPENPGSQGQGSGGGGGGQERAEEVRAEQAAEAPGRSLDVFELRGGPPGLAGAGRDRAGEAGEAAEPEPEPEPTPVPEPPQEGAVAPEPVEDAIAVGASDDVVYIGEQEDAPEFSVAEGANEEISVVSPAPEETAATANPDVITIDPESTFDQVEETDVFTIEEGVLRYRDSGDTTFVVGEGAQDEEATLSTGEQEDSGLVYPMPEEEESGSVGEEDDGFAE